MSSPEQAFLALTAEADKGLSTSEGIVAAAFAQLQSVDAAYLTKGAGEWKGHSFSTGHPAHEKLKELNWAGKKFRSKDDVDPVVVYDSENKRVWSADWGHAQLREMSYEGKNTIAMVYDNFPIIDYFRFVTPDLVAGAMDSKMLRECGTYYFFLTRIE